MNSDEYSFARLPYNEFDGMTNLCRAINKRISARKNDAFLFNYSME